MNSTTATHSFHSLVELEPTVHAIPRLRILYHVDLARIGATTSETVPMVSGEWQLVGRKGPFFSIAGHERPLDDPLISRAQLRIRWLSEKARFEVEPSVDAKRALRLLSTDPLSPATPITDRLELPPGVCLAIGDRAFLGLEVVRSRSRTADRMGLVGESEALWSLRDEIRDVGTFDRPALIMGPTGAGKELVARAVHAHGSRARGPFIPLNCAALPEHLVESMLFGHVRGAFTGADRASAGLFVAADGGTLFLDEIGELPLSIQPKLLRVLQDGRATPVGAHDGRHVDFRLVAATHRDLSDEVAAGRLREDLYHRVAAHVLRVPSLAARRFDIPELFVHFLEALASTHTELRWLLTSTDPWRPTIPDSFFLSLLQRSWSGNVREIQNCVEQVARHNLRPGPFQSPGASPIELEPARTVRSPVADSASTTPAEVADISAALGLAWKTVAKLLDGPYLSRARDALGLEDRGEAMSRLKTVASDALFARLDEHDFNQSRVASALGTSRTTLVKLMRDLGLRRATDLTLDEIDPVVTDAAGDLDRAAQILKVSSHALKKQMTLLRLRTT